MKVGRTATLAIAAALAMLVAAQPAQAGKFHGVVAQGALSATDFSLMRQANVGNLRVTVPWERIQPTRGGPLDTLWLDAIVNGATARGIRVMLTLSGPGPTNAFTPPTSRKARKAYANVAGALARRYGRGGSVGSKPVTTYQIYNEQNGFYWGGRPNPAKYAKLLKAAAKKIKAADRRAEIALGGMFGTPSAAGGIKSWRFLKKLYKTRGVKKAFNTVAIHPYAPDLRGLKFQIKKIRRVLKQKHDGGTKLRITEIGFGSQSGGHPLNKGGQGQASALRKALGLLERKKGRYKLRGFNWFSWQDNPTGGCAFCTSSGLVRANRTTKPSYLAFKQIAG